LVMEWAATAATAMVALTVSLRLMNSALPFSTALTVLILTPEFFMPIRQYALRFHSGTAGKAAANRIYDIIDAPMLAKPVTRNKSLVPPPGKLDITFQEVSFTYEGEERPALQEISLTIPQGNRLLIAGSTGSGKTTISQLLMRFAYPGRGQILVGGLPLQDIEIDAWRHQVAWVPQLPHLFHGTVGDNIRLGKPKANQEEITVAATAAQAHDFINKLPQGYETPVGEGGARLSGGQRQRIAIARALLKDAPILLLDEPTAHLDRALEQALLNTLNGLTIGCTIIIIAHHLEPAFDFDQIVVMEQGQLTESSRGSDLNTGDGRFRRLLGQASQPNGEGDSR
jgi:ATP-binding cassette subfamily C protein CydD